MKTVMCIGTWPEENYADFIVHEVLPNETEEAAIARAICIYGKHNTYYIKETTKGD